MMKNNHTTSIKVSKEQIRAMFHLNNLLYPQTENDTSLTKLKDIYWYEKQLMIAIPMLISSATTSELAESLTVLAKYTRAHMKKLEKQFPGIDKIP